MEAYSAGQRHFGENYVDELLTKAVMVAVMMNNAARSCRCHPTCNGT